MPLYYLQCDACNKQTPGFFKDREEATRQSCKVCGSPLKWSPRPPSSQVVESLDNGVMATRVERLKDAELLHQDRSRRGPG